METVAIDGMDEHEFRHSVEDMLRSDQVDDAVERLRTLLEPYAMGGGYLPARFLDITPDEVGVAGIDKLASRLANHDRPGFPITAIGVVLADARVLGGPGPKNGRLAPFIKTYYFSDDAYPFTEASRDDLLEGYTREGFGWQADYQATDATLSITGIDDLHGALIELEDRLLDLAEPPQEAVKAGSVGACYLAALIQRALRDAIRREGLPRPLCVLAACDGVYPFFDAPVAGWDEAGGASAEEALDGADAAAEDIWPDETEDRVELAPAERGGVEGEGSLLSIVSRKGTKAPALALSEDDAREAVRATEEASAQQLVIADESLRGLFHGVPMPQLGEVELFATEEEPLAPQPEPEVRGDEPWVIPASFVTEPDSPTELEPDWCESEPDTLHRPLLPPAPSGHSLRERFRAPEPEAGPARQGWSDRARSWLQRRPWLKRRLWLKALARLKRTWTVRRRR